MSDDGQVELTSLTLSDVGSAVVGDIDTVRVYIDTNTNFAGATEIGNAAFSTISAAAMLFASESLASATGIPAAALFSTGIALLIFAADLVLVARGQEANRLFVWAFIGADGLWVVGSVVALAAATMLTPFGQGAVAAVAAIVATFGWLQYRGLRASAAVTA